MLQPAITPQYDIHDPLVTYLTDACGLDTPEDTIHYLAQKGGAK